VLVTALDVKVFGAVGAVDALKEEDVLAPPTTALTTTVYVVAPVKPVNIANLLATPASVDGTVVTPPKVYV
jgi:hypothetical protein